MDTLNTIIENDKLIAEFMGFVINGHEVLIPYQFTNMQIYLLPSSNEFYEADITDLCFDTDWNWLMPVVEKIESIPHTQITISGKWCRIGHKGISFDEHYADNKIEATYNAVVKFIEWYNENK